MKGIKLILALFVFVGMSINAFAFSDDFSGGLGAWTVNSGSFTTTNNELVTTASGFIQAPIESNDVYFSFDVIQGVNASSTNYLCWAANSGAVNAAGCLQGLILTTGVNGITAITSKNTDFVLASLNLPYKTNMSAVIQILNSNTQIRVRWYYKANGTLLIDPQADQTVNLVNYRTPDFILISDTFSGGSVLRYDNILTSAVSPTTTTTITWDAASYVQGDTATFSWSISNTDWNNPFSLWHTRVTDQTGNEYNFQSFYTPCLCYTQFGLGTQTGSYSLLTTTPGTYTVHLDSFFSTDVSTDTMNVLTPGSAFIVINSSVPYHTQVPVSYNFGFGGVNLNDAIQTYFLNPNTNTYEFEHSFFGLSSGTNTRNVYFEKVGIYVLRLRDVAQDKIYAQTTTTTTFAAPETTINITTSSIFFNKTSYYYGDTIFGNYTIDSTNWTSGQLYLDVFNWDKNIVTSEMIGGSVAWTDVSLKQQGDFLGTLLNAPATDNFPATTFVSGNNALRLMVKNATGATNVLASKNFTLTDTTLTGYGLRLSKYAVLTNEKFFAYAIVPENGAQLMLVNTGTNVSLGTLLATIGTNESPMTVPISIPNKGNYAIVLNDPFGIPEIMQNVVVSISLAPTPTETPITVQQKTNEALNLLSSNLFWALLFICGLGLAVAVKSRK